MAPTEHKNAHELKKHKSPNRTRNTLLAVLVLVVIVVVLYYVFFLYVNQTVVNTPATANITTSGTVFSVDSQQYLISLASVSMASDKAYIHISRLPIFVNPLLNVTLTLNNVTKINAGTVYANMGIQLMSIGQNSITAKVSPLYTSLAIPADSQDIVTIQGSLYNSQQQSIGSTSTINQGASISSTTATTASTTTLKATNYTSLEINTTLKDNAMYALMLNFSELYSNTTMCTPSVYNSTYIYAHGTAPSGQNSYENISQFVPYNISHSLSNLGKGDFGEVFKTKTHSPVFDNVDVVTIDINASSETILNETISSMGVFSGLNYAKLRSNYVNALAAGGPCGVEV
ncbi:MAG: hypothetical protein ACREBH_04110 [Candidatus Micrarchaeaceae archaeon]